MPHVDPAPYRRRRDRTLLLVLGLLVVSVGVHLAAFGGLTVWVKAHATERALNRPIELVMVDVEPPPPPPPPPEEPEPEPPKPPPIKVARTERPPPPPKDDAPPPPNEESKEPPKPVPLVAGISMSSTTTAGGFAAPVGNTAYGRIESTAQDPAQVKPYSAPKYVPSYQVDSEPRELSKPKIPFPAEARRAGVEGAVILSVRIDAEGNTVGVKILEGPGYGLEEAAAEAIRRFKWKPAIKNGEPVATEIKYRYTFLLD